MENEIFPTDGPYYTIRSDVQPSSIMIRDLVTIHLDDGRIEYGPKYTPDEAAKVFWEALSYHMPRRPLEGDRIIPKVVFETLRAARHAAWYEDNPGWAAVDKWLRDQSLPQEGQG